MRSRVGITTDTSGSGGVTIRQYVAIRPDGDNPFDWLPLYRDLLRLATTSADRFRFARAILALSVLRRSSPQELTFSALDDEFRCWVTDASELAVFSDIFLEEEYSVEVDHPVRLVVDLGSHVGLSVLWFHAMYPEARIIAVEPHPVTFDRLRRNVGRLDRVELINVAVADAPGTEIIHAGDRSWSSSLSARPGLHATASVETRRLDDLLADRDIDAVDLLKVDIEGAEYPVLSTFEGLSSVGTIIGEFHPEYNNTSVFDFLSVLHGFEPVRLRGDTKRSVTFVARRLS